MSDDAREHLLEHELQLADVAEDQQVDRVDLPVLVPQVDLRDARLAGRDLHLRFADRRGGDQLGVVHHQPRNARAERENLAGVDRHLEPLVGLRDVAHDGLSLLASAAPSRPRAGCSSRAIASKLATKRPSAAEARRSGSRTSLYFLRVSRRRPARMRERPALRLAGRPCPGELV